MGKHRIPTRRIRLRVALVLGLFTGGAVAAGRGELPPGAAPPPQDAEKPGGPMTEIESKLLDHLKKIDAVAGELQAPDFPAGKEWFNSPPLSFRRDLKGKVTVLDFWTYCCINCIHVLPDLAAIEEKYAGFPVAVVGVHSAKFANERDSENVRQAVLRYDIRHPVVNDDEMALWRAIGVRSWPTLAVVGPKGNLLLMVSGEGNRELLDAFIATVLKFYPPEIFRHDPLPVSLEREKRRADSPLRFPGKLALDAARDRLYISDSNHHRIVVVDLEGRHLETIGSGRIGLRDGSYEEARFHRLQGLALDGRRLYVADAENHALRAVDLNARRVETVAGDGTQGRDHRGGGKGRAQRLSTPWDVAVHGDKVFIAMAGTHQIWIYEPVSGVARAYSGDGSEQNLNHSDPLQAAWAQPSGLAVGGGELFVADSESSTVRAVDLSSGATRTVAGGDSSEPRNLFAFGDTDGIGDEARLQHPLGVLWIEAQKRVLVADTYNHRLKLVDPASRRAEAWVGSGRAGIEDGEGTAARFSEPSGFALGAGGEQVYVADTNNHAVRVVDLSSRKARTLVLKGVPEAPPAVLPRSQSLADVPGAARVEAPAVKVAPGGGGIVRLKLSLPEGHHLALGAPSRWQVLDDDKGLVRVREAEASGPLEEGEEVAIAFSVPADFRSARIEVEALAYFCKEGGACLIGAVRFEVPLEAAEAAESAQVHLKHAFKAEMPRLDALAPAGRTEKP